MSDHLNTPKYKAKEVILTSKVDITQKTGVNYVFLFETEPTSSIVQEFCKILRNVDNYELAVNLPE